MDLICTNCMEPWDIHYVLHDEPEGFTWYHPRHGKLKGRRGQGGTLVACPCCPRNAAGKVLQPELSDSEKERQEKLRVLGEVMGGDVDGMAAMIEDFGLE